MILRVHQDGARSYPVGDGIWDYSLAEAIDEEVWRMIYLGDQLELTGPGEAAAEIKAHLTAEMTGALVTVGDRYVSPEGILYTLEARGDR